MKAFIITEGGFNMGYGHITRCLSLYQAFEEKRIMPEFIVNGEDSIENLLKDTNYQVFNWLEEKNKLFKLLKHADIAIIDSYLADISIYENVSVLAKTPVYIDDNRRLDYPRGIVVNGNIHAEELNYPDKDGLLYLLGTKYTPLRKEFWNVPDKEIEEKTESIMVTLGGDDANNMTPKVLEFLTKYYPMLKKNIIIGNAFQNIPEIEKETDKNTNLICYPDAKKMKEIMLGVDIAISGSGQTLYELARVGVPTIGICVAENQLGNIKGLEKAGFLEYIGWYNEDNFIEKLNNSMQHLEDVSIRTDKSKIGKEIVDGKGVERTVREILREMGEVN